MKRLSLEYTLSSLDYRLECYDTPVCVSSDVLFSLEPAQNRFGLLAQHVSVLSVVHAVQPAKSTAA